MNFISLVVFSPFKPLSCFGRVFALLGRENGLFRLFLATGLTGYSLLLGLILQDAQFLYLLFSFPIGSSPVVNRLDSATLKPLLLISCANITINSDFANLFLVVRSG